MPADESALAAELGRGQRGWPCFDGGLQLDVGLQPEGWEAGPRDPLRERGKEGASAFSIRRTNKRTLKGLT